MTYVPPNINGQATSANSQPIVIASDQSAVPISAASLPLPTGGATSALQSTQDTSINTLLKPASTLAAVTSLTQMNGQAIAMGTGVRSAGTQRVTVATDDSVPVTGAFFQTTQPISAASLPLPTGASTETTLAALNTKVTAVNTGAVTISAALPTGANTIGAISNTTFTATQATPANLQMTATPPAITKGTQGTTGFTVQSLNDAGRNLVTYYTVIPVLATATDTLLSLTGTKSGATVTATTTPAVVTTGKTLRITRFSATYVATATSGYAIARLRFNTAGVVAITSPIAATLAVAAGTPATANSGASEDASIAEGKEFAAGTGIGISVQGFAAATATAVGYVFVSVSGYEY